MTNEEYEKIAQALWELTEYKYCLVLEYLSNKSTKQEYFENNPLYLVP